MAKPTKRHVRPAKTKISQGIRCLHCRMRKVLVLRRYIPFERTAKADQTLGHMGALLKNDVH